MDWWLSPVHAKARSEGAKPEISQTQLNQIKKEK
jgi:hypothetical protein